MTDHSLPLAPLPEDGPAIKQALARFSLSALLGAGALLVLMPATAVQGASRARRLRRIEASQECADAATRCREESGGSTPSR
jgi:hypothetical protein